MADGPAATAAGAIQLLRVSAAMAGARTAACRSAVLDAVMARRRLMVAVVSVVFRKRGSEKNKRKKNRNEISIIGLPGLAKMFLSLNIAVLFCGSLILCCCFFACCEGLLSNGRA